MFWSPQLSLDNETVFKLVASPQACVGPAGSEFIMGGVAQAAAIEAAEIVSDKPLLWSTIQFVNAGLLNQSIDIEVEVLGGGRSISQVLVTLTADGTVLQTMSAALGGRQGTERQFVSMPRVAAPEDSPIRTDLDHNNDALGEREAVPVTEKIRSPNGVSFLNGDLFVAQMDHIDKYVDVEHDIETLKTPVTVVNSEATPFGQGNGKSSSCKNSRTIHTATLQKSCEC